MLGDERLLSGREEPPDSPRLKLWSRKWDTSGQSKSCQWEAEVSFFNSHRTQMSVMPWGEAEDIRSSTRGKKAEQTVTALQRNTRIGGSGARIGRKAGARQRGSELSVHAGRC